MFPGMGYQGKRLLTSLKNNTVDCVFQFYFTPHNYEQFFFSWIQELSPLSKWSSKGKLAQLIPLPADSWPNDVVKSRIHSLASHMQFWKTRYQPVQRLCPWTVFRGWYLRLPRCRCLSQDRACEHSWSHWNTLDSQVLAGPQRLPAAHRQLPQRLPVWSNCWLRVKWR